MPTSAPPASKRSVRPPLTTDAVDCIFCEIVAGRSPAHVVAEDERTMAFMDINPLVRGHVLVVPRAHATQLWEMTFEDGQALMRVTQRVADAVHRALEPDGINLLHATGEAAGQTVFHVHLHVVPRWFDDGFRPPMVPERGLDPDLATPAAEIRAALDGAP
jgi:histidine triad (HIT) family protein